MIERRLEAATAIVLLRVALAALICVHGVARLMAGGVAPFGQWLGAQGLPAGAAIAWAITLVEILGTPVLAFGRLVRPLCLWFAIELSVGMVTVHAPNGWFVVGLGRNGMEYSVLLIVGFLLVGAVGGRTSPTPPTP